MGNKLLYENVDISNEDHIECLREIWKDNGTKEYYERGGKTFEQFLSIFNETINCESLIKVGENYIGWVRMLKTGNDLEIDCIILKRFRNFGFGKEILSDIINKNRDLNIKLIIRRDNYVANKMLKVFPFCAEGLPKNGLQVYKLSRNK